MLYSAEAETNILGSLIIDNDKFVDISDLKAEEFYEDRHRAIFNTMRVLYNTQGKFDIVVLTEALKNDLDKIGGITYLTNLEGSIATTSLIKKYKDIVKDYAIKRKMKLASEKLLRNIEKTSTKDIAADLEETLNSINCKDIKDEGNYKNVLVDVVEQAEKRYQNGGGVQGIKTGLKIDQKLNGLQNQDFIIIAARPSIGKTTFAEQIFLNVVFKENKKAAFFSLEMSKAQLLNKAISNMGFINHDNLVKGKLTADDFKNMGLVANKLDSSENMKIYDKLNDINEIKATCKKLKMQNKLDVVFIDYLGLIRGEKAQSREQEVSKISAEIKAMAKDLDIPVVVLSQLNRGCEMRGDKRPILSDLRDSGSLEQDCDSAIFLYRDEYYNENSDDKGLLEVIIAKNRNGETGKTKLAWRPEYCKVTDLAR